MFASKLVSTVRYLQHIIHIICMSLRKEHAFIKLINHFLPERDSLLSCTFMNNCSDRPQDQDLSHDIQFIDSSEFISNIVYGNILNQGCPNLCPGARCGLWQILTQLAARTLLLTCRSAL